MADYTVTEAQIENLVVAKGSFSSVSWIWLAVSWHLVWKYFAWPRASSI